MCKITIGKLNDLLDMLEDRREWKDKHKDDARIKTENVRPTFTRPLGMQNTAVYVNAAILKKAAEKAQHEAVKTGGTISKLIELLLWQYIGSSEEFLDRE